MKFVAIAMMLAAAGTCSAALGAQSSVSVTNVSVTLSNAAAPLATESTGTAVGAQVDNVGPGALPPVDGFLVPLAMAANSPDASASATISDDAGPAIAVDASATDNGFANSFASSLGLLIVPAYTSATISADFSVSGTGSGVYEQAQVCMSQCGIRILHGTGAADFSLTWTYANDSGNAYPTLMDVYASAFAPGIPEPGERLMMLAGLASICVIAKRRRTVSATSR